MVAPPPLPALTWNPFETPREIAERRYRRHLDEVAEVYKAAGYRATPERRQADHLWWLAGYRCCGWTKNRIASAARKDHSPVIRAIKHLAAEIGLTLRPTAANDGRWTSAKIRAALKEISA